MSRKESEWEDFEEFEKKVDEISQIIGDLSTGKISCEEFDCSLDVDVWQNDAKRQKIKLESESEVDEAKLVKKKIPSINPKPTVKNPETLDRLEAENLSQDAFIRTIEEDANRRSRERAERNEKAAMLMKKGNSAFRDGCFERALGYFNEAIDTRRDSSLLYTNRAVTYLKLGLFTRAVEDCERAIKLKKVLKPHLLKCKALKEMGDTAAFAEHVQFTRDEFPRDDAAITEYLKSAEQE